MPHKERQRCVSSQSRNLCDPFHPAALPAVNQEHVETASTALLSELHITSLLIVLLSVVITAVAAIPARTARNSSATCTCNRLGYLAQQKCYRSETYRRRKGLKVSYAPRKFLPRQAIANRTYVECCRS